MTRREQSLVAVVVLLLGVLAGVLLVVLTDDQDTGTTDTTDTTASSTTAPTTSASETTSSTLPDVTTTSSVAPPITSTTTTTTTTTPPAPTIDAAAGTVLGFDVGAPLGDVVAALSARHGTPDMDSGWVPWCEFLNPDGRPDSRYISFGDLRLEFNRSGGNEVFETWRYLPRFGATAEPEVVGYDDVLLPPGVEWFEPLDTVAAALGSTVTIDDFGQQFILTPGARFEWADYLGDPVFDALSDGDIAVCD